LGFQPRASESKRERDHAWLGCTSGWAERGKKRREAARVADFVFLFQKYEIVTILFISL
jgi:hypothetical protein